MRTAKQQAKDLDQAGTFLSAMLNPNGELAKSQQSVKEQNHPRQSNGRSKGLKIDHVNRFSDPPAPPPQQPLPEKPDAMKPSPVTTSFTNLLKRNDTAKSPSPGNSSHSPTNTQSSQMTSLMEALRVAKKELDSQGARVKQLEELLKDERNAREQAEDRARKLEQHTASRPVSYAAEAEEQKKELEEPAESQQDTSDLALPPPEESIDDTAGERQLKEKLDNVLAEMQKLKSDVEHYQKRANTAEEDASRARASLAEMINQIREENAKADVNQGDTAPSIQGADADGLNTTGSREVEPEGPALKKWPSQHNGHVRVPRLPEHLEQAVATVLKERHGNGDSLTQSAPYVSMLGVVLIGVGLMAYLNSWQKSER